MGRIEFSDTCSDPYNETWSAPSWPCNMVAGWTKGQSRCQLWDSVVKLCQTEPEKRFLHYYLQLVRDREFPMLIPQVRIGVDDNRRVDFAAYVPVHYWRYNWYAVELDGGHTRERTEEDRDRRLELNAEGYKALSFRPGERGYFDAVKQLVRMVEHEMAEAECNPESVAVDVPAEEMEEGEVPF